MSVSRQAFRFGKDLDLLGNLLEGLFIIHFYTAVLDEIINTERRGESGGVWFGPAM